MRCIAQAESEQEYKERVMPLSNQLLGRTKIFKSGFRIFGWLKETPEGQERNLRNLTASHPCFLVYFLLIPLGKEKGEGVKAYNYPIITLPFTWLTFLLLICCSVGFGQTEKIVLLAGVENFFCA